MGSRNFGLGHRDMKEAGRRAISEAYESGKSYEAVKDRWNRFVDYLRNERDVKKMEDIRRDHIEDYARRLRDEEKSAAYQQNSVSAINRVLEEARRDREMFVKPSDVCDRRSTVAKTDRSISEEKHQQQLEKVNDRTSAMMELQRRFGLRFEESSKLDARSALKEAEEKGKVTIEKGTKGGQKREIEIRNINQIEALRRAAEIQQKDRSMIPGEQSYKEFSKGEYRSKDADYRFHGERHAYAQERYREIVGHEAPIKIQGREETWIPYLSKQLDISPQEARDLDHQARMQISKELGHHREDVTAAYLGGKG